MEKKTLQTHLDFFTNNLSDYNRASDKEKKTIIDHVFSYSKYNLEKELYFEISNNTPNGLFGPKHFTSDLSDAIRIIRRKIEDLQ